MTFVKKFCIIKAKGNGMKNCNPVIADLRSKIAQLNYLNRQLRIENAQLRALIAGMARSMHTTKDNDEDENGTKNGKSKNYRRP